MNRAFKNRSAAVVVVGGVTLLVGLLLAVLLVPAGPKAGGGTGACTEQAANGGGSPADSPSMVPGRPESALDPEGCRLLRARLEKLLAIDDRREWPGELDVVARDLDLAGIHEMLFLCQDEGFPVPFRKMMRIAAHDQWLELDPAGAVRSADSGGIQQENVDGWMEAALRRWASRAPGEALAFLRSGELRHVDWENGCSALAQGAAQKGDCETLAGVLAQIQSPALRDLTIKRATAALWMQLRDTRAMEAWIATLPQGDQGLAAAESTGLLASTDPVVAAAKLQGLRSGDPTLFRVAASRVLVKWARQDPAAAAEWLTASRFDPPLTESMLALLLREWASQSASAPEDWLAACQQKGLLDEALIRRAVEKMY